MRGEIQKVDTNRYIHEWWRCFALHLCDGAPQELAVEIKPHIRDMPTLVRTVNYQLLAFQDRA